MIISGCATISSSNEPSIKPDYESVTIIKENKKDVTFSVGYHVQMNEDVFVGQEKVVETVRDTFKKSELYGKVTMNSGDSNESDLHYHFDIKVSGPSVDDQMLIGYVSGLTLMLIPVWISADIDATMFVFKNGKEIHSASISTVGTDIYWAPLVILTPFLNHATVGSYNKNKIMRYFMNEIIEQKLY